MTRRVLVVHKATRDHGEFAMVRLRRSLGEDHPAVKRALEERRVHRAAVERAKAEFDAMDADFAYRVVGADLPEADLIVTLGGDGTLLWASHAAASGQPMIAINTSPTTSVGYFCAGEQAGALVADALDGKLAETQLARMRVALDGAVLTDRVLNDVLFSHACPAATTAFVLETSGGQQMLKSSGVWVATAAGSTAAIRSAGGAVLPWDSRHLQYAIREPYVGDGQGQGADQEQGVGSIVASLEPSETMSVVAQTQNTCIYLDGPHRQHHLTLGNRVTFSVSEDPLTLLGLSDRRGALHEV